MSARLQGDDTLTEQSHRAVLVIFMYQIYLKYETLGNISLEQNMMTMPSYAYKTKRKLTLNQLHRIKIANTLHFIMLTNPMVHKFYSYENYDSGFEVFWYLEWAQLSYYKRD